MRRIARIILPVLALVAAMQSRAQELPAGAVVQTNTPAASATAAETSLRAGLRLDAAKDFSGALVHFQKAAEQGSAEGAFRVATYRLGGREAVVEGGSAVSEDLPEAIKQLQRAAHLGHVEAMRVLGACLTKGRGVPQDKIEARKWWRIAAARGDDTARAYLELTAEELSTEELAEAERRAADLAPKIERPNARPDEKAGQVRLMLNGISGPESRRVALINNQAFSVGEQKKLSFPGTNLVLRCVEITTSTVRVQANDSEEVVTLGFAVQ